MSIGYRGNPDLWAFKARLDEQRAAELAEAEALTAEEPEALADAGGDVPEPPAETQAADPAASEQEQE